MKNLLILCFLFIEVLNATGLYDYRVNLFSQMTNKNDFQLYLKNAYLDVNWIKANELLSEKKEIIINKNKEFIPKWKDAVIEFKKSASTNILSAYQGAYLIDSSVMAFKTTNKDVINYINDNIMDFINPLVEQNYCYGYVVAAKYYLRFSKDYKKGFELLENGSSACAITKDSSRLLIQLNYEYRINNAKLYHLTHNQIVVKDKVVKDKVVKDKVVKDKVVKDKVVKDKVNNITNQLRDYIEKNKEEGEK